MLAAFVRSLGLPRLRHALHEARMRAVGLVFACALALVGMGFIGFAAYRGLALVMAPALAATVLGLALILVAALAYAWSTRGTTSSVPRRHTAPPPAVDPAAELGESFASLLRRSEVGSSDLATASLVAGFVLGSRRRTPSRTESERETADRDGRNGRGA